MLGLETRSEGVVSRLLSHYTCTVAGFLLLFLVIHLAARQLYMRIMAEGCWEETLLGMQEVGLNFLLQC